MLAATARHAENSGRPAVDQRNLADIDRRRRLTRRRQCDGGVRAGLPEEIDVLGLSRGGLSASGYSMRYCVTSRIRIGGDQFTARDASGTTRTPGLGVGGGSPRRCSWAARP